MWKTYFHYNNSKDEHGMISFYFLPTIEYFRYRTFDDYGYCSFNISLQWLFWSLTFTRYWGSVFENNK